MNEYIRTKDGIYRILQWGAKRKHYVMCCDTKGSKVEFDTSEIVASHNTIEELCDEYVCVSKNGKHTVLPSSTSIDLLGAVIYGAIWTDKGLIYVAKMNDKGELELI